MSEGAEPETLDAPLVDTTDAGNRLRCRKASGVRFSASPLANSRKRVDIKRYLDDLEMLDKWRVKAVRRPSA